LKTLGNIAQITRFLISGGIGTVVYFLTLYLLTEFAGVWYIASSVIAFLLNSATTFVFQKLWTFKNRDSVEVPKQLFLYTSLRVGLLATSTTLLYALVEYAHIHYLVVPILLMIPLTIVSFILTKKIFTT
jgi:dolichol-phosphate mannosyltransferase